MPLSRLCLRLSAFASPTPLMLVCRWQRALTRTQSPPAHLSVRKIRLLILLLAHMCKTLLSIQGTDGSTRASPASMSAISYGKTPQQSSISTRNLCAASKSYRCVTRSVRIVGAWADPQLRLLSVFCGRMSGPRRRSSRPVRHLSRLFAALGFHHRGRISITRRPGKNLMAAAKKRL